MKVLRKKIFQKTITEILILSSIGLSLSTIAVIFVFIFVRGDGEQSLNDIAGIVRKVHFFLPILISIGAILFAYLTPFHIDNPSIKNALLGGFFLMLGLIISYPLIIAIFYIPSSTIPSFFYGLDTDILQRKELSLLGWDRFFFEWFWVSVCGVFLIIISVIKFKKKP